MENRLPLLSIIIPTYNRAHCIGDAIMSVVNQTFENWELIICDDDSTDDTDLIVNGCFNTDNRIRYYRNEKRLGLPANRNVGWLKAQGRYIMFLEDDVTLGSHCLAILVDTVERLENIGIKVGAISPKSFEPPKEGKLLGLEKLVSNRVKARLNKPSSVSPITGLIFENFTFDRRLIETDVGTPWSLFSAEALTGVHGFNAKSYNCCNYSHEESDLFIRLRNAGYKIYHQPEAIAYHHHSERGGTRTSQVKYFWYYLLGHIIFVTHNFGWKSLYMIPCSLGYLALNTMLYLPRVIFNG